MANKAEQHLRARYYPTYVSVGLAVMLGVVSYFGLFHQQKASAQDYVIRGFDVSHHQGEINWKKSLQCSTSLSISKPLRVATLKTETFRKIGLRHASRACMLELIIFTVYVGMARCRQKILLPQFPKRPMPCPRH